MYTIESGAVDGALDDDGFASEWRRCLREHQHPTSFYASPEWVRYLRRSQNDPVGLWLIRDRDRTLRGVVAARLRNQPLDFGVGNRILLRHEIACADLLGSTPALPESEGLLNQVLDAVFAEWPACQAAYLDALPTDSELWQRFSMDAELRRQWHLHVTDGPRPWHLLELASSFDEYLKSISSKARESLRRQARQLAKALGPVTVQRVTDAAGVPKFLETAAAVSRQSWQHRVLGERIRTDERTVAA